LRVFSYARFDGFCSGLLKGWAHFSNLLVE
jgi:hypothetical protein